MIDTQKHNCVCGITGSGKTTFCMWLYRNLQTTSVFFNTQLERKIEKESDYVVSDYGGFQDAINEKGRKICINPPEDPDKALELLIQIKKSLFELGKEINKGVTEHEIIWCHLFIDEIHEFSDKDSPNSEVDNIFKRGRRNGIVGVAISQRPAEVSHNILTMCTTHIIFRLSTYERGYFDRYKIPIFKNPEYAEWINKGWGKGQDPKDRYNFLVFDLVELEKYPPIKP